jgi:AraC-like DNA-binding protein
MVTTCLKLTIMAPPRVGKEIESLILRLREDEKWTMEKIAQHVKMHRSTVSKIIRRLRNPRILKTGGKPRATDKR